MLNNWHKKEKPIQGMMGMGGGATGYLVGGAGGSALGTADNPVVRSSELVAEGIAENGYYYFKGQGADNSTARPYFCFLNSSFPLGVGWIVVANHDGQKTPVSAHQPRLTGNGSYVGYDNSAGNGNVNSAPGISEMVPNRSFSQNASVLVWQEFIHAAYGTGTSNNDATIDADTWLTIQTYYYGAFNSNQTIGTDAAWTKSFNTSGQTVSSHSRRFYYGTASSSGAYSLAAIGCYNDRNGSNPTVNGQGATSQNYPVFCSSFTGDTGSGYTATFSWCDESVSSNGWDDWQDGSGMGDSFGTENVGYQAFRGYPSFILLR